MTKAIRFPLALLFILLASGAKAATLVFHKSVNKDRFLEELRAGGVVIQEFSCAGAGCTVKYSGKSEPELRKLIDAHVYDDPRLRIARLAPKLRNRTITSEERDQLLQALLEYLGL